MNWRQWIFGKIGTVIDSDSVFAGGSIDKTPAVRPFVIYRIQDSEPVLRDNGMPVRMYTTAEVWMYDDPGSYDLIDSKLRAVRYALIGQVALPDKVCCEWQGDSIELFDDQLKCITRNSTYQLIGGDS